MKQFDITFFGPIPYAYLTTEAVVADIAAAGITLCQLFDATVADSKRVLPLLKKYGMNAIVADQRIAALYSGKEAEKVDSVVRTVAEDYAAFDNVTGFEICDEPTSEDFPIIAQIVAAFRKYAPDRETVVNLFPNYATLEQLRDTSYESHLEHFVQIVKPDFISYDHYHFLNDAPQAACVEDAGIDERERMIRQSSQTREKRDRFFVNLEQVRQAGLKNGLEQMLIVLLTEHGWYRNLTRAELRWEVNMCLAYGMHRISYFTYWQPDSDNEFWHWQNAMCDCSGNKLPHYYDAQAINAQILPIGRALFRTKSEAVFHIGTGEKGGIAFEGYANVTAVTGSRGVIGFFEDGSVYLVNHNYEAAGTFTVHADRELSVYSDGAFVPCGKTYTVTLDPGAGVMFR